VTVTFEVSPRHRLECLENVNVIIFPAEFTHSLMHATGNVSDQFAIFSWCVNIFSQSKSIIMSRWKLQKNIRTHPTWKFYPRKKIILETSLDTLLGVFSDYGSSHRVSTSKHVDCS